MKIIGLPAGVQCSSPIAGPRGAALILSFDGDPDTVRDFLAAFHEAAARRDDPNGAAAQAFSAVLAQMNTTNSDFALPE